MVDPPTLEMPSFLILTVSISHRLGKGKVVFEYYSEEDLTRLIDLLGVRLD